jgi:hypothetical protein
LARNCNVEPCWLAERDAPHVSLAVMISPLPTFLTISHVMLKDSMLHSLSAQFETCRMAKGYITTPGMPFYIEGILSPCCTELREKANENLPVLLIMDNLGAHNAPQFCRPLRT